MRSDFPEAPAYLIDTRWGVAYDLHRVRTGIGRDAGNVIVLRDLAASRSHAEVERDGDRCMLHPMGSAETRVNGLPLTGPHELREGDLIEVAYTRLRFTRQLPAGDVLPAPTRSAVDEDLAAQRTEVRETLAARDLRRLRRQGRQVTARGRAGKRRLLSAGAAIVPHRTGMRRLLSAGAAIVVLALVIDVVVHLFSP